jgi:tetratricopeptide (TPR) repeat protein
MTSALTTSVATPEREAWTPGGGLLVLLTLFSAAVAVDNGGYFPSSWGWAALGFLWIGALAVGRLRGDLRTAVSAAAFLAFLGWIWLSSIWAPAPTVSIREGEHALVLVAGVLAALALLRRCQLSMFVLGLVCSIGAVCGYGLFARLFPHRLSADDISGYRLTVPIGSWNALGVYAAIGIVLAVGLIARDQRWTRAVAATTLPILATSLYFTYSRGALVALAVGLFITFALDTRRTQWLLTLLPAAGVAAVAVVVASRSPGLTTVGASLHQASIDGHRLAILLIVLCPCSGALARSRVVPNPRQMVERWMTAIVSAALIAALLLGIAAAGGPVAIRDKFTAAPPATHGQLNKRLLSVSGTYRAPLWSLALHEYESHPVLGAGSGSYEAYYLEHRTRPDKVKNAHNLYLETLAELGPLGLALLLVALLTPLYAAVRARRHVFVPALAGAYVAFLVHVAVDWDWQVTAVALTGLFCGAAILVAARSDAAEQRELSPRLRYALLGATLFVMVVAFIGLVGNMSLAQAATAAGKGNWAASAKDAKRAHTWAPWSSEPYRVLGEAQLGEGDTKSAIASFNKAIAKSPDDWNLWFDLARATTGHAQRDALRHAKQLNPLSPEIAELQQELNAEKVITVVPKSPAQK